MKKFLKNYRAFLSLNIHQKKDVLHIAFIVLKISLIVLLVPLRLYYAKYLLAKDSDINNLQPFHKDIRLINNILKHIPWRITCLMECLIVKDYLFKYDLTVPIKIGVHLSTNIEAHAWYGNNFKSKYIEIKCS